MADEKIVEFLRKHDYKLMKELGQGACGKTVLLHDETIDEYYVCKKYSPANEAQKQTLFSAFVREIKLLHRVQHPNVVRFYNHWLYPDKLTGFILMEYVNGYTLDSVLVDTPQLVNDLFHQAVDGFRYLEAKKILHRDIRPANVLVGDDDALQIIDLGFGKQVSASNDFGKSISLNWWCQPPREFESSLYDFRTEVYFLGKLFEGLIQDNLIEHFEYADLLRRMCQWDPADRIASFFDVANELRRTGLSESTFSEEELQHYRAMADALEKHLPKLEMSVRYKDDVNQIVNQLETVYRSCMLEKFVPDAATVLTCFINGSFYVQRKGLRVDVVRDFLQLLKTTTREKAQTIIANIHARLSAIETYDEDAEADDIPF